jgi:formylglycine-generating enzyme required for sulfatase activity
MSRKIGWFLALLSVMLFLLLSFGCSKPVEEKAAQPTEPAPPVVDYNEMVLVPAGKCIIGGPADNPVTKFSSPPHEVELKGFWIDKYEVTFEQFMQFVADSQYATKGNWRNYFNEDKPMLPVFNVIFDDAVAYAKWAKKRLPTQEEWEKAASWNPKEQKQCKFPWGDVWDPTKANTATRTLADIGKYAGDVSFYGVHDMMGNVYEWTDSFYDAYPGAKVKDKNFGIKLMVVKGASLYIDGQNYPLSARAAFPSNTILSMGFRCAKDATPDDEAKNK